MLEEHLYNPFDWNEDTANDTGLQSSYDLDDPELCKRICQNIQFSGTFNDVEECELNIDESLYPGAEDTEPSPHDVVGTISCQGVSSWGECKGGRRPLQHREPLIEGTHRLANQLAAMAHMEHASITAFQELARQLKQHHAPTHFVERCLEAAEDERQHEKMLSQLASSAGGRFVTTEEHSCEHATLYEIALHNAVEGCINEAWAACLAVHQGFYAQKPLLRRIFQKIGHDEIRHAQLAWDLHEWLLTQLSPEQGHQIQQAQQQALASVQVQSEAPANNLLRLLGCPDKEKHIELKHHFFLLS